MEQLRKRFDTGLDISELLIDEKAVIDQPEVCVVAIVYMLLSHLLVETEA